jgi:hypothetical protein
LLFFADGTKMLLMFILFLPLQQSKYHSVTTQWRRPGNSSSSW